MEAAVASGILKIVANKLVPLLMKQYSSIVGAKKDLQELHGQVVEINSWLESVGDKAVGNDPSFNWLKELKDIAYEVDDIVDEFELKAEKHETGGDGGIMSKYLCNKPKSIIFQCKVATKIKAIKKKFAAIVKQRKDFSTITNSLPANHPHVNMKVEEVLTNIDATSILGRDKDKDELISKLVEVKDQQTINIVSIIGLGGSGKTTLAKLVFNEGNIIDKHFELKLWVHVSQEFDVAKLIGKLFEAIAGEKSERYLLQQMSEKISDKLTGKRYLLVFDDVWTSDQNLWDQFMVHAHLKSGTPGSAILLTTRSREVAGTLRSTDQFDLPFLSPGHSWELFQQRLGVAVKHLEESEFVEVGKEILKKCGGVPLAIRVIADILRGKELNEEWQAIRDSNLLNVKSEEDSVKSEEKISACLMLSYLHLPSHMKQCFTVCSVFPKGYMIDKEQLIDQWIAHDMITPQAGVEFLDIGDKYFNSLVQMSFLQDVAEDWYGRAKCRMHDLVHDLALSILDDKISLVVPKEATSSTKSCRYFSLIEWPKNLAPKNIFKKTRVVYIPCNGDYTYFKAMKHAKHLRSVMVGYVDAKTVDAISQVKYLKYLSMPLFRSFKTLPECISNVWSLQALHVANSHYLVNIPESIGKLRKLRTLNLSCCYELKHLPESIGDCKMISSIDLCFCKLTMLPHSIGKLQKLSTLNLSRCVQLKCLPVSIGDCQMISSINLSECKNLITLPESIGRNKKLRVLRLGGTRIERLPSSIKNLRNLERLDLEKCYELVELPEGIANLKKLQVLNLKGCNKLGGMPVGIGQLSRLQKLALFVVGKGEKFAGISELSNVSQIGDELTIKGMAHVIEPKDAHMACLKQKTHLQKLVLECLMADYTNKVNIELQQTVLDGLEPPPGIKELQINSYSGRRYARWMQNQVGGGVQGPASFPFLRVMKLSSFLKLKNLHGLVELPCLEELSLSWMPSLEGISGGPFPSLVRLKMFRLECLGEVWMVAERTMLDEEGGCFYSSMPQLGQIIQVGNCLTEVEIRDCPMLKVKLHLPQSVQHLIIYNSEQLLQSPGQSWGSSSPPNFNQLKKLELYYVTGVGAGQGWELLQHMIALDSLDIHGFSGVETEVPESLWSLTSLRSLQVKCWYNICMLPESIGELRSLQELTIESCYGLSILPPTIGQLTSLRSLKVQECSHICMLPEWIGELRSLQELTIKSCCRLSSLPQSMGQLTSLQVLVIEECEALKQLPDCLGGLCSLRELKIKDLRELTCLPESICRLTTSLQELEIYGCTGLTSLLQGIEGLTSLEKLSISNCTGLTSLPQGIKGLVSLEKLKVHDCPEIQALPEGIKGLTALKELQIFDCPDLVRRCDRGAGEDWHLISHIPDVWLRMMDG